MAIYFSHTIIKNIGRMENELASSPSVLHKANFLCHRMAKIYCHINQCNANVQYFAILHADKFRTISEKPTKLKIRLL